MTGYLERLEYGSDFDGQTMTYKFRTADKPLSKTMMNESQVRKTNLMLNK